MRKLICCLLVIMMIGSLTAVAWAASDPPEIIMQPQSANFPEYSVASYTVRATGSNLRAFWFLEWQGNTYDLSDNTNPEEPWEGFAGASYGGVQEDANTFLYFFSGIGRELDGAYIYCVIEDGHYDAVSQKARVSVGSTAMPPIIENFPTRVVVEQGEEAEIRCLALAPGDTQLSFLWYETDTGRMEDMRAVNRGEETSDYMFCDTSQVGTRYYLCKVESSAGGITYSSIVEVTVTEKTEVIEPPAIETNVLPEAQVGKAYKTKIICSDPNAQITLYYSPGGTNEFEKSGLTLSKDGTISGTPKRAGEISFSVCAAGAGGEDYMTYVLIIHPAPEAPPATTPPATTPPATTPPTTVNPSTAPAEKPTGAPTVPGPGTPKPEASQPAATAPAQERDDDSDGGFQWWILAVIALVGMVGIGAGVGVALILVKKK